jgi:pantoate--beta-alanine ligase
MKTFETVKDLQSVLRPLRMKGMSIGFVPTMGALHDGHLSLARTLKDHCDVRVCSIFVNPTQFNDPKDYEAYTINLEQDKRLLEREGVDILFAPRVEEMYPTGFQSSVMVSEIAKPFEGALRPGHFTGVATVVTILFNAVTPDVAIFGEKDFQQLALIERMVLDLKMGIKIVRGALVRDADGLALSSRNARLSADGRQQALLISRGLFAAREAFRQGERRSDAVEAIVRGYINQMSNPAIDYVTVVDEATLAPAEKIGGGCRVLVVARVEGVRLLDNIALD